MTATAVRTTLPVSDLANGLARIAHIGSRGPLTCTSSTLLEFREGGIRLTNTDLDQWARTTVPCDTEERARLCLPSDVLGGLVRSLRKGEATMVVEDGKLLLGAGGDYVVAGSPADEFPAFPECDDGYSWTMDAEKLAVALKFVAWCRSTENARPVLWGTLLDMEKGRVVSCSGHNLAIYPVADPVEGGPIANMPGDGLAGLLTGGEVRLATDGLRLTADTDQVSYSVRLIEGLYPPVDRVVPTAFQFTATIHRSDLMAAVGRARLYVGRHIEDKVRLTWDDGSLHVSSSQQDAGSQRDPVPTDASGDFETMFATGYLASALKHLDGESVLMRAKNAEREILWSTADDPARFYIVMPKRDLAKASP